MFHGTRPGWIEVISGVMFAGKSEELIRRVRRAVIARKQVQVFKSHLDARYAGLYSVTSHDGLTVDAAPVDSADQIMRQVRPDTEVVAIDEAQFLDGGIVTVANALADRGDRRRGTSVSSTASPPPGTARRSWWAGGSRTRRDADTATESRSAMKTRRPCCRDIRHQTSDISVLTSDV